MAVVNLRKLSDLPRVLVKFGQQVEAEMPGAMRSAARFGATAVLRESARTRPRPKASGAYERSWIVNRISDGATVSNSARHAIFVERGRKAGRAPPRDAILEWIRQKRLGKRRGRGRSRAERIAYLIQRKIAKRGIPGRFILRNTMPVIAKRANFEIRKVVRRVTSNPPR